MLLLIGIPATVSFGLANAGRFVYKATGVPDAVLLFIAKTLK